MRFRAKRELFNQAFLYHYQNLLDISPLRAQYPEAADLFEQAQQTVDKRDELIEQIAKALAGEKDHTDYIELAREEWRKRNLDTQQ